MKNEIILYRPNELAEHIEVWLEDETVWLSQAQMAMLFSQTKQNISLHINNCFKEGELEKMATVKENKIMIMNKKTIIKKLSLYKKQNLNKYQIKRIGIFGSASKDCMNDQSDIDIVVELEKPDLFYMIGIKQDLEATFNMPIDIVRYRDKMNDALKRRINLEAIYV